MEKTVIHKPAGPFNMSVAQDTPATLTISRANRAKIADYLAGYLDTLPLDDYAPAVCDTALPVEDHIPATLLRVIETLPSSDHLVGIRWQKVKNLPGFNISQIRKLGRDVFESLDCFQAFSEQQKAQGRDPHAEILIVSDFTHGKSVTNFLAELIVKHGVEIERGENDYGALLPGYHPKVVIMMTAGWTFKLVQDRTDYGAPVNLNSIYAWPGGLAAYKKPRIDTQPALIPG